MLSFNPLSDPASLIPFVSGADAPADVNLVESRGVTKAPNTLLIEYKSATGHG